MGVKEGCAPFVDSACALRGEPRRRKNRWMDRTYRATLWKDSKDDGHKSLKRRRLRRKSQAAARSIELDRLVIVTRPKVTKEVAA